MVGAEAGDGAEDEAVVGAGAEAGAEVEAVVGAGVVAAVGVEVEAGVVAAAGERLCRLHMERRSPAQQTDWQG